VLFSALGIAVFLEGLPYFVAPNAVRRYMSQIVTMSDAALRTIGLVLMLAGLGLAYLALHR